jgi:hypothetical protein
MSRLLFIIPAALFYWVYDVVQYMPKKTPLSQMNDEQKRKFWEESKNAPIGMIVIGIVIAAVGALTVAWGRVLASKKSKWTNPVICLGSSLVSVGTLIVLRN